MKFSKFSKPDHLIIPFISLLLIQPVWAIEKFYTGEILTENNIKYSCRGKFIQNGTQGKKIDEFLDGQKNTIIKEDITFQASNFKPVNVLIENIQSGRLEEIVQNKNSFTMRFREHFNAAIHEKTVTPDGVVMHGSYVPMFIAQKMDSLLTDHVIRFQLLVIDRLGCFEFLLRKRGEKMIDGQCYYEIELVPNSWIIKPFVGETLFYYRIDNTREIIRYHGTIALRDENGNPLTGDIIFHYPED